MADYTFDLASGQYRDPLGRLVPAERISDAAVALRARTQDEVAVLAQRLASGTLAPARWEAAMAALLREAHLTASALAVGGWAQLPAYEEVIVDRLTDEFLYLGAFRASLAELSDAQIAVRAAMYASNVWATFQQMRGALASQTDMAEERNVLGEPSDSCPECLALTDDDWVPLDTLPEVGERQCLSNCNCSIEYRSADEAAVEERALVGAGVRRAYNPDQPREPAGSSGGGEYGVCSVCEFTQDAGKPAITLAEIDALILPMLDGSSS